ncbi:MAG: MotA/TolQ/ExbB proton channel family protein [Calditrichaeota bacterium]|nr:MotA/TolQ/ExbB proton channel family protein [Calditrichota bacterium]MCB9067141.1 MotA/TolQ/ExbB proton channel family protein [Calditrichia bacterium]
MTKLYFQGGNFMLPILVMWIFGLIIGFVKLFHLLRAEWQSRQVMRNVQSALRKQNVRAALAICETQKDPVSTILTAGLIYANDNIADAEKAVTNVGSIQTALLERGMIWLGFIIVAAPMLGFTGTVWGMVEAFKAIQMVDDISPAVVAGGISQALLTTLFGLVVAMSIQLIYNLANTRIDQLVLNMEEVSILLVDSLKGK